MHHTFTKHILIYLIFTVFILLITSCSVKKRDLNLSNKNSNDKAFITTMQKHLDAITNKDITTLTSTMSPTGAMQLILPQTEIIYSVEGFLDYHRQWFAVKNDWTFETEILNSTIYENFGMAIVEIVYREPERNGQPYFNRMIVSYDLEKINGHWYIVKDHASSVEKSTDKK